MSLFVNILKNNSFFKICFVLVVIFLIFKGIIPILIYTSQYNFYIYNTVNLFSIFILVLFCILNLNLKDLKDDQLIILNIVLSFLWLIVTLIIEFSFVYVVSFITSGIFILYLILLKKNKFNYKEIYILFAGITLFYSSYYIFEFFLLNSNNLFIELKIREIRIPQDGIIVQYNIHTEEFTKLRRGFEFSPYYYAKKFAYLINGINVTHTHTMGELGHNSLKRPNGLIDVTPHTSAYLFSILSLFWFGSLFQTKSINKKFEFFLFVLTLVCLIASAASSIIVSYVFIIFFFAGYIFFKGNKKYTTYIIAFILAWIFLSYIFFIYFNFNPGYAWIKRLNLNARGWRIFVNGFQDVVDLKELILPSLIGFVKVLELSKIYNTEFAFLKMFFEKGVFLFTVLMLIFIKPLFIFFKNNNILSNSGIFLPCLMFFGGLLHYGLFFKSEMILINLLLFSYIRNKNEE